MTIGIFLLDQFGQTDTGHPAQEPDKRAENTLSVALAIAHFGLFALAIWTVGGDSGLTWQQRLLAFFAFGLFFGQVSNSNAHDLIHRPGRLLHWLGAWIFISHLFGHHTSAHRLVHHRFVATAQDPNSAPRGQSFYRFAIQAWLGSFWRGLTAENERRRHKRPGLHPYFIYVFGGLAGLGGAWLLAGGGGVLAHLALAAYATCQLLLSDYVQHYGLRRQTGPDGRLEPVGLQHSWDAPQRFSSLLMLNASHHADHHVHPARAFATLEIPGKAAILPYNLATMGLLAWSPHLWRRVMDPKVARQMGNQDPDVQKETP